MNDIFRKFLDLLFPPRCASCKKEGEFLCEACFASLDVKPIAGFSPPSAKGEFEYLDGLIYGVDYAANPAIGLAIAQFKYKFTQDISVMLAELLAEKLGELKMTKGKEIALIPVPLHSKRMKERGFNQSMVLSKEVQRILPEAQIRLLLVRHRQTSQQAKLKRVERLENLLNAFTVVGPLVDLDDSICFLVDDVCTTGSTLESCAKTLKEAGIKKVYGLVAARAFK